MGDPKLPIVSRRKIVINSGEYHESALNRSVIHFFWPFAVSSLMSKTRRTTYSESTSKLQLRRGESFKVNLKYLPLTTWKLAAVRAQFRALRKRQHATKAIHSRKYLDRSAIDKILLSDKTTFGAHWQSDPDIWAACLIPVLMCKFLSDLTWCCSRNWSNTDEYIPSNRWREI